MGILIILEWGQDGDTAMTTDHIPSRSGADMVDQGIGTILAENGNEFNAGVHQVGQREVDHP